MLHFSSLMRCLVPFYPAIFFIFAYYITFYQFSLLRFDVILELYTPASFAKRTLVGRNG